MHSLDRQIARAGELLNTVQHAAMATVNEDGSPHNTPYFFMGSKDLTHLYRGSHPQSEHSKNSARTGQIFVVLYDAFQRGGLYIRADAARVAEGTELTEHNRRQTLQNRNPLPSSYYEGDSPQRMYIANTRRSWAVMSENDAATGLLVCDIRTEISKEALLEDA